MSTEHAIAEALLQTPAGDEFTLRQLYSIARTVLRVLQPEFERRDAAMVKLMARIAKLESKR